MGASIGSPFAIRPMSLTDEDFFLKWDFSAVFLFG
jgi:hypothetical protein